MHRKLAPIVLALLLAAAGAYSEKATPAQLGDSWDILFNGKPWLRTMSEKFDPKRAEETYKVYTHVFDFDGKAPITKGPGGKFPHHRGLYLGWKDTMVNGEDLDTWHMSNSIQAGGQILATGDDHVKFTVDWQKLDGKKFIEETRELRTRADGDRRVIDFASSLTALEHKIELKGDLQHAGMQIRMAQEVAEHEDTTSYILPEGAQSFADDKVTGAWWVCCSCVVNEKRYWVLHMSPPGTPGGIPVYSIRKYARFGAFFEPTLEPKKPLDMHFRVVVSEQELDQKSCQAIYDAFAKELP